MSAAARAGHVARAAAGSVAASDGVSCVGLATPRPAYVADLTFFQSSPYSSSASGPR